MPDDRTNASIATKPAATQRKHRRTKIILASILVPILIIAGWVVVENDYAITEQHVTIPGPDQPLQGFLALPRTGHGPFGLVVFVHGDGPIDATHDTFYRPIWEAFARAGYASLSWDKPGVDGAQGNWLHQSMSDRAAETAAAIDWSRTRTDLDPRRTGLWGASQAGWVIPEVAARRSDLRFLILVAPALNWLRQGEFDLRAELRENHASDAEVAVALRRRATVLQLLRENATYERYLSTIDDTPMPPDRWDFVGRNYTADASEALTRVRIPVLLALGDHDSHVDVAETARGYRDLLPQPQQLTIAEYTNATHGLVRTELDNDGPRAFLTAVFAPRSLFAPGFLADQREYAAQFDDSHR
ncbi:alpha/beta hydrolase [Nocardia sp. SYP-A9097]|uniref:alpha/beta hydrolase family protein n=1 Tax=Nocardia sp. SYP-A9097 TaxID=2663237 RepID=UPI00129BBF00|nr:alpha/beta hydrolase [Nocardia sp. SYP-A9097]